LSEFLRVAGNRPEFVVVIIFHHTQTGAIRGSGWAVFEATDHSQIAKWLIDWIDLNVNDVTPIITDQDLHEILA